MCFISWKRGGGSGGGGFGGVKMMFFWFKKSVGKNIKGGGFLGKEKNPPL